MDKLKEYLLRHKADLDVDAPASDGWEYIASKMPGESHQRMPAASLPAKSASSLRVLRYAAAACVIVLAGAGLWLVMKNNKTPSDTAKLKPVMVKRAPASGKERIENASGAAEKTAGKDVVRNTFKQARHQTRSRKAAGAPDAINLIDKSYSSLIDYQLRRLRVTPLYAESSNYFSFYLEQFKQMDRDEQRVRNDIKTYGLTSEFLEQLINVYQQKLDLLKDLETEVNKMNNKVREKQAPSERAEVHYLHI